MAATSFNPLDAARDLKAAGIEAEHAEAIAGAVHQAAADRADLATKADLAEVRNELRADLHRKIETLRSEMRWMFAFQGAIVLAVAARLFGIV